MDKLSIAMSNKYYIFKDKSNTNNDGYYSDIDIFDINLINDYLVNEFTYSIHKLNAFVNINNNGFSPHVLRNQYDHYITFFDTIEDLRYVTIGNQYTDVALHIKFEDNTGNSNNGSCKAHHYYTLRLDKTGKLHIFEVSDKSNITNDKRLATYRIPSKISSPSASPGSSVITGLFICILQDDGDLGVFYFIKDSDNDISIKKYYSLLDIDKTDGDDNESEKLKILIKKNTDNYFIFKNHYESPKNIYFNVLDVKKRDAYYLNTNPVTKILTNTKLCYPLVLDYKIDYRGETNTANHKYYNSIPWDYTNGSGGAMIPGLPAGSSTSNLYIPRNAYLETSIYVDELVNDNEDLPEITNKYYNLFKSQIWPINREDSYINVFGIETFKVIDLGKDQEPDYYIEFNTEDIYDKYCVLAINNKKEIIYKPTHSSDKYIKIYNTKNSRDIPENGFLIFTNLFKDPLYFYGITSTGIYRSLVIPTPNDTNTWKLFYTISNVSNVFYLNQPEISDFTKFIYIFKTSSSGWSIYTGYNDTTKLFSTIKSITFTDENGIGIALTHIEQYSVLVYVGFSNDGKTYISSEFKSGIDLLLNSSSTTNSFKFTLVDNSTVSKDSEGTIKKNIPAGSLIYSYLNIYHLLVKQSSTSNIYNIFVKSKIADNTKGWDLIYSTLNDSNIYETFHSFKIETYNSFFFNPTDGKSFSGYYDSSSDFKQYAIYGIFKDPEGYNLLRYLFVNYLILNNTILDNYFNIINSNKTIITIPRSSSITSLYTIIGDITYQESLKTTKYILVSSDTTNYYIYFATLK